MGTLKALGVTLLVFVVLGPVVQPWYLSWGLVLLAPVALGWLRSLIIWLSMVTAFLELPGGSNFFKQLIHGDPLLIVLTLLWLLVVLTVPLSADESHARGPAGRHQAGGAGPVLSPQSHRARAPRPARPNGQAIAQSRRWRTETSSQRLNLRPTSRSTPTSSNPHACAGRSRPCCSRRCGR